VRLNLAFLNRFAAIKLLDRLRDWDLERVKVGLRPCLAVYLLRRRKMVLPFQGAHEPTGLVWVCSNGPSELHRVEMVNR